MGDQDKLFDEEAVYAEAFAELKSGNPRAGLWAKAFAESNGDESKSQAFYIRLRVQLEKERKQHERETAKAEAIESERRKAADFLAVIEQLHLKGYEARKSGNGWTVREPLGGRVKLNSDIALLGYADGRVSARSLHSNSVRDVTDLEAPRPQPAKRTVASIAEHAAREVFDSTNAERSRTSPVDSNAISLDSATLSQRTTATRWLFRIGAVFLGAFIETIARVVDKFAGSSVLIASLRGAAILGLIIFVWHVTRDRKPPSPPAEERKN